MPSFLLLTIGLAATFGAIVLVGVAIDFGSSRQGQQLATLETQIGAMGDAVPDLRQEELGEPAWRRLLVPGARKAGGVLLQVTPGKLAERTARNIVLAGSPEGWDVERIVGLKVISAVVGVAIGVALANVLPIHPAFGLLFVVLFGALGFVVPSSYVSGRARSRQRRIQRQLPDVMDLLTISVEAGLGFDAALSVVSKNVPGPLADEISRTLQEMLIGVGRTDAFRHLGERTDVPELDGFILSMIQADLFGIPMANVLRVQSKELRVKRRQRAEELAQKVPVKILFPLIFCVLPALFVVILGPGAIKVWNQFFS